MKANEPGTLQYTLHRSREDTDVYYAIELYTDEAAVQAHMQNFQARKGGADVLAAPVKGVLQCARLVGFHNFGPGLEVGLDLGALAGFGANGGDDADHVLVPSKVTLC